MSDRIVWEQELVDVATKDLALVEAQREIAEELNRLNDNIDRLIRSVSQENKANEND